jgi:hypothetical protein
VEWKRRCKSALSSFVTEYGALCAGIVGEDSNHPSFIRLSQINLDEIVTFVETDELTDERLSRLLSHQHELMWSHLDSSPGWTITLLGSRDRCNEIEVILTFHHALFDGQSALHFHHLLLEALCVNDGVRDQDDQPSIIAVPLDISMLPPVENLTPLPQSLSFIFSNLRFMIQQYWGIKIPEIPSWPRKDSTVSIHIDSH